MLREIVFFIFVVILVGLLIRYWKGTTAVTRTFGGAVVKLVDTLQSPGDYPKG
jgi:Na+/H+ antiporter NhaD/arsenite permease-like protein